MSIYNFRADLNVEASSEEDALNKVGAHLSVRARHLANERSLDETEPMFTLTELDKEPAQVHTEALVNDPIRTAREADEEDKAE